MQPSHLNNDYRLINEGLTDQIDSDIKAKKQRLFKEFEDSPEDPRTRRPKHSQSKTKKPPSGPQMDEFPSEERPFAPFVANTLKFEGKGNFVGQSVAYVEKHNLIIGCPNESSLQAFDATTLLPRKEIKTEKLDDALVRMSFFPEAETLVLGCLDGQIYAYNLSNMNLRKIQKGRRKEIVAMTFLNSGYYAFSQYESFELLVGNLHNEDVLAFNLNGKDSFGLYNFPKRSLLFSTLQDSSIVIYRTDRLPKFPILYLNRDYKSQDWTKVLSLTIKGKDFIVTAGYDEKIQIWHLTKGKMKKLKGFSVQEGVVGMVYLENYKMLAVTFTGSSLKFFRFPSGKLESTLGLGMKYCQNIFLMKDKNALGVAGSNKNIVKIIQLHK